MARLKNPRIRALENKVAKLQEQLKKYEANTVVDVISDDNVEDEIESIDVTINNMTEFQFVIKENGEFVAIQTKPESKVFRLGDNSMRAEFQVKKLLAHGDILPKKSK